MHLTVIDVNLNRASEGIRVIEELVRHELREEQLFAQLRSLRHRLRDHSRRFEGLVLHRQSDTDPGRSTTVPKRADIGEIFTANFKRVQESLRVLEEITDGRDEFMQLRFETYDLEKMCRQIIQRQMYNLRKIGLYVIGGEESILVQCVRQGVRIVQLRDKTSGTGEIIRKAERIRKETRERGALFIINDRPDIARIVDADGVHVGQDDMTVAEARSVVGPAKIIGKSTHCIEQAREAQDEGADYIGVGPLWTTPTKAGRPAAGLEFLRRAVSEIPIPFVAIGGIDMTNIDDVLSIGACNIAVVRAAVRAPELMEKIAGARCR